MLEVQAPEVLRYSWRGSDDEEPTEVIYRIEPLEQGTRLTYDHTGFSGFRGTMMSRVLGRVRRKTLDEGLPPVLAMVHEQDVGEPVGETAEHADRGL